ncbi:MAG TPA: hypothetical protein VFW33_17535 [Gemmataceae bacterium]|nr:hypothetical protein [Gemmataceae bacterium]
MTLQGTVRNGVIVLDPPRALAEGIRVEVIVPESAAGPAQAAPTLAERLLKHAGTVTGLPADMAEQHDHYTHGTPKR